MKKINKKGKIKKVFVSGCFDLVHSGHVEFFKRAAKYGDLYVSIASDKTYRDYKHQEPLYNEQEKKFIIENLRFVKKAFISRPRGELGVIMNFASDLKRIKPDYFVVGDDSNVSEEKKAFVESVGAQFVVIKRAKFRDFTRSTTSLRKTIEEGDLFDK